MAPITLLFFLFAFHSALGQSTLTPEQALLHVEEQHLLAMINHNHEVLADLYDEQFHGVLASGQAVNKTKVLEFLESGSPHVLLSIEDVKAAIFGSIGITTGKVVSKSKLGSVIGQSRFIHIYLKKNDQWKIIESQGTVIIQE